MEESKAKQLITLCLMLMCSDSMVFPGRATIVFAKKQTFASSRQIAAGRPTSSPNALSRLPLRCVCALSHPASRLLYIQMTTEMKVALPFFLVSISCQPLVKM